MTIPLKPKPKHAVYIWLRDLGTKEIGAGIFVEF
jgi:hypothetical protein